MSENFDQNAYVTRMWMGWLVVLAVAASLMWNGFGGPDPLAETSPPTPTLPAPAPVPTRFPPAGRER